MVDEQEKTSERVGGRPFPKGRAGNPAGRRRGSRNQSTMAARMLLAGEAEALTHKAVELALTGDPTALPLARTDPAARPGGRVCVAADPQRPTGQARGLQAHDVAER
jgi:Family of unknown function (DUF5681)